MSWSRFADKIEPLTIKFTAIMVNIAAAMCAAMMFLVVADIIGRKLGHPIIGAIEISQYLLAWITMLGLAAGLLKGSHIRVTMLVTRFNRGTQLALDGVACIFGLTFFVLLLLISAEFLWESVMINELHMGSIAIPAWIGKVSIIIGALSMIVAYLIVLFRLIIKRQGW